LKRHPLQRKGAGEIQQKARRKTAQGRKRNTQKKERTAKIHKTKTTHKTEPELVINSALIPVLREF